MNLDQLDQRETEEIRHHNAPEAMPAWPCPTCGISLREHTSEMITECTRRVQKNRAAKVKICR